MPAGHFSDRVFKHGFVISECMSGEMGPGKILSCGFVCACCWVCIHACVHRYPCFPTDLEGVYNVWGCLYVLHKIQASTAFASPWIVLVQA